MKALTLGEPVRVTAGIPSFWHCIGRIIQIVEPFVSTEQTKAMALFEMPLYFVRLEDGRRFRFRGRDLEPLTKFDSNKMAAL
jgi:hypothetical protein